MLCHSCIGNSNRKMLPLEFLLDWWSKNHFDRPCYIGLGIYRAGSNNYWRDKNQLPRQIRAIRNSRLSEEKFISAALLFSEIRMGGMIRSGKIFIIIRH